MPMPSYPVRCFSRHCGQLAVCKIAARWSDGVTQELKTYALCCEACLHDWYVQSIARQKACRLTAGETLETPGIYLLAHGQRDRQLERRPDLEALHAKAEAGK